ncbi:MAG: class I SAM-dependent methyltransferase [Candidatus Shapirobacteria bacterium]
MDIRKQHTKDDYAAIAKLYTMDFGKHNRGLGVFIDPLVSKLIENNLEKVIIDLGTGPGKVINYLIELGIKNKIIGVDFVQEFCDNLKIKYSDKQQVEIVCDDFVDYVAKQPNNSISAYTANYSIIHVLDEELNSLMKNIERSLQKNGLVVFTVYEGTKKGMEPEPYQTENDPRFKVKEPLEAYLNNFTKKELKKSIKKAGLKVINIQNLEIDILPGEYDQPKIWALAQKK